MTSGGSTGRPKLIVAGGPGLIDSDANPLLMMSIDGTHLMPGPLYHNGPFVWSTTALLAGNHVVLGGRFDAEKTLALIDRWQPDTMYIVPTMMTRISKLPEEVRDRYDVSSLRVGVAPRRAVPALAQARVDRLARRGAIWELYAGTEAQSATVITGTEWLEHRGSVGRPLSGEMKIVDADGNDAPARRGRRDLHASGRRASRRTATSAPRPRTLAGGWESLGDMGMHRRRRLPLPRRPPDRHDPRRRRQRVSRRGRGRARRAPARCVRLR